MALNAAGVVVTDITFNHSDKFLLAGKTLAIIAFPLQNAPKSFHWPVVNAVRHTGHALRHPCLLELAVKGSAGVLESPVAMEQGMGIRIGFHSLVKGFVDKWVIIALTEHIGHDTPVTQVEDGTEIKLMHGNALIPFELGHISQPFLIRLVRIKLAVQNILRNVLGVLGPSGTTVAGVLDGGFDVPDPTDTQHTLIVDMDAIVVAQIIIEPSVAFIRAFAMDFFHDACQALVLHSPSAQFSRSPLMVSGASYMEQGTGGLNGIILFLVAFLDGPVNPALPYFCEASLLSISSNFFSRSRSISARYSLCLSCSISICACSNSVRAV